MSSELKIARWTRMTLEYDGGTFVIEGHRCGYRFEPQALIMWEKIDGEEKTHVFPISRVIHLHVHQGGGSQ